MKSKLGMRTKSWGGLRKMPFAFTEQGIYMLMTVLKGEQAIAQSKALIRLFKQMKDYIAAENAPDVSAGISPCITHYSKDCCKMINKDVKPNFINLYIDI